MEQQAKLFTGLEELRSLVGRIASQQIELIQHVGRFQEGIHRSVLAIAEQQKLLTEQQKLLTEEQRRLAEAQRHTEERLNALITVVDGIVRGPSKV